MRTHARGFTIVELLIVSAISILLMTVGAYIYSNCLKIYQEGNGAQTVYETSKFVVRDFRAYLGNVVPVPGAYITPRARQFAGVADAAETDLDSYYWGCGGNRTVAMSDALASGYDLPQYDLYFSGAQTSQANAWDGQVGWMRYAASSWGPETPGAACGATIGSGNVYSTWWMPGFFGKRDGAKANVLKYNDMRAGSWGWPRPDYRLDADAVVLSPVLDGGSPSGSAGKLVSCWFYAESPDFDSVYTKTLDNPNIVLVSIKFSMDLVGNREETQLSFLRHQIAGLDGNGQKYVRSDQSYGNMLRAVKIDPLCLNASGELDRMDDAALGCDLNGTPSTDPAAGRAIPRAFDVRFTLANPANMRPYRFALRIYCGSNAQ
ncbi:MAG: prepilin-type N-terminal cleavage/methylation domain-containing protein [Planctomycetota bacterium]|nr:prepilin-type N-terminal cleavage/methylation domain-containing protein [Planctomycetota bacterium]